MRPNDGRAIPTFLRQAMEGKPLTVFGDGSQTRSFCYVDDLIEGLFRLTMSDEHMPVNIGNPNEMTLLELAERVISLTVPTLGSCSRAFRSTIPRSASPISQRRSGCWIGSRASRLTMGCGERSNRSHPPAPSLSLDRSEPDRHGGAVAPQCRGVTLEHQSIAGFECDLGAAKVDSRRSVQRDDHHLSLVDVDRVELTAELKHPYLGRHAAPSGHHVQITGGPPREVRGSLGLSIEYALLESFQRALAVLSVFSRTWRSVDWRT